MPRYLGIVFPAFAIAICARYLRLPRPLRYAAISFLRAVNLAQSLARLGPDGRLASTDDYPVRVYWTWSPLYAHRRQSFEK